MKVLDYLSISTGIYLVEIQEINKRLQRRGLDANAIVAILPHMVNGKQHGVIVYYKRLSHSDDEMVFSEEGLNV